MADQEKSQESVVQDIPAKPVETWVDIPLLDMIAIAEDWNAQDEESGKKLNTAKELAKKYGEKFSIPLTSIHIRSITRRGDVRNAIAKLEKRDLARQDALTQKIAKIEDKHYLKIYDNWLSKKNDLIDKFYHKIHQLLESITPEKIAAEKKPHQLVNSLSIFLDKILDLVGEPRRVSSNGQNVSINNVSIWFNHLPEEEKNKVEDKIKHYDRFTPFSVIEPNGEQKTD